MATAVLTYDSVDITAKVLFESAHFESSVNGAPGPCSFRVRDESGIDTYVVGKELVLTIDGAVEWRGFLTLSKRVYIFPALNLAESPVRFHDLEGTDLNILFTRRIVFNQTTPEDISGTLFPIGTSDADAIADLIANFLDLSGDGLDTTTFVDTVANITVGQKGRAWEGSDTWGQAMASIARLPGAIFYLDPDKNLVYCDVDTTSAPFGLSDQPNGTTLRGYREMEILKDGTGLANDALVIGAGYGSSMPVFRRLIDAASVAAHGLWQTGQSIFGVYKQSTLDYDANSIVYGSPENKRGAKDDRLAVMLVTYEPGLRVAQKVDFHSEVFGFSDVIPIRKMEITFPEPETPRYGLTLSHDIDAPFSVIDNVLLPGFSFPPFPIPGFPPFPDVPTCNDVGGDFIDTFNRTTSDTVEYLVSDLTVPSDRDLSLEVNAFGQSNSGHQWYVRTSTPNFVALAKSHVNGSDARIELDSTQGLIDDWEGSVGNGGVSVVDYANFDFSFTAVDGGFTMLTTVNLNYIPGDIGTQDAYTSITFLPTGRLYAPLITAWEPYDGVTIYIDNVSVVSYAQVFAGGIGSGGANDLGVVPDPAIINVRWQHHPPDVSRVKVWFFPFTEPAEWTETLTYADAVIPFYGSMAGFQVFVEHQESVFNSAPNQVVTIPELLITKDYGCTQCENATEITVAPFDFTGPLAIPGSNEVHATYPLNVMAVVDTAGACTATIHLDQVETGFDVGVINEAGDDHTEAATMGDHVFSLTSGGRWYVYLYSGTYDPSLTGTGTYEFAGAGGDAGVWSVATPYLPNSTTIFVDTTFQVIDTDYIEILPNSVQFVSPPSGGSTVKTCYLGDLGPAAGVPAGQYVCEFFYANGDTITLKRPFLPFSSQVWLLGAFQRQGTEYTENPSAGTITFGTTPPGRATVRVCYFSLA